MGGRAGERPPPEAKMPHRARVSRAQALALPRPASAGATEWWVAAAAVALLLAGLLGL